MVFEVLDSRDGATRSAGGPDGSGAPIDVVDLTDDLDRAHPGPTSDDGPPVSAAPRSAHGRRSVGTALFVRRHPVALVVLTLLLGALLGGSLARRSAALADQERRESTVAVAAQAVEVMPYDLPIGLGAQLLVSVTNLGPLPVSVGRALRAEPASGVRTGRVTVLGSGDSVAADTTVRVMMRMSVDCRVGRVLRPTLGVRTADGVLHSTPVTMPEGGRPTSALCPRRSGSAVTATLVGTVQLPALQLVNQSPLPVQVSLPPQGLSPWQDGHALEVVSRPTLPTTLGPNQQVTVRLRFIARGCIEELQALQRLDLATLTLASATLRTASRPEPAGQVDVDVTGVVAAAMVRYCG